MKTNLSVGFSLALASIVIAVVALCGGDAQLVPLPMQQLGGWTIIPDSAEDADRDCAEAVVKNAIIESNLGACQDGLKTIQVKKQTVVGVNYKFVISNIPGNCDSLGGPELCTGTINIHKGIATLIPLSVSCQSPANVMLH